MSDDTKAFLDAMDDMQLSDGQVMDLLTDVTFAPQPMSTANSEPRFAPSIEEITTMMLEGRL